jgi:hypothetical protein
MAFLSEDLVKEYINKHAKVNKRSWKSDGRLLNKEVVPPLQPWFLLNL